MQARFCLLGSRFPGISKLYLTKLDGQAPQPILSSFLGDLPQFAASIRRVTMLSP
jgi:hypothetical protein